ncbi:MAG TPA: hypothetical protein VM686_41950 [Polyangiaceae bacterium]|nr:hypothetical protein [Polyangiaceae bacterium]
MRGIALAAAVFAWGAVACDAESRACRSQFGSAQDIVTKVKSDSPDSLRGALSALDAAIVACDKAKLGHEKGELTKAKNQLAAHLEVLERRAARKKKAKPTPEQIAELVKNGDPTCPKGQAYLHGTAKKEIRCTGPQLYELGFEDVKEYFSERRYKITTSDSPPMVKAEFGAELYQFDFQKPNDAQGARCVSIFPAPGISWEELVSKLTGVGPEKLKAGQPIKTASGPLGLKVENTENKVVARVGNCD